MTSETPQYLLFSEASRTVGFGRWRFVLRPENGGTPIEATDIEPEVWGERLDLLTVVRALETLDQPSRVTLVGCSRYVEQGVLYGIQEWKENGWRWECFGQMTPVRDADLWQRMDRALQFHRVECRQRRIDARHGLARGPHWNLLKPANGLAHGLAGVGRLKSHAMLLAAWCGAGLGAFFGVRRLNIGRGPS